MPLTFLLLGPVEATTGDGAPVGLGRRQERCLLGLLLLEPNRVVPVDRLLDLLWDGAAPPTARRTIHTYVARLRALLKCHDVKVLTHGDGYLIEVAEELVDAHRFTAAVAQAQQLPQPAQRATELERALAMWRGPLLADVADDRQRDRIGAALAEQRLGAIERHAEARLDCGQPDRVVADLVGPLRDNPAREHLTYLLMLALYRCDRQVEALARYRETRQALSDGYGVDPSATLRDLHDRVLRRDPTLATGSPWLSSSAGSSATHHDEWPAPRMLPRDIPEFVGRAAAIATLRSAISAGLREPAVAPVILSVDGMAGVGKTALALRIGHLVSADFPGGQLYLDLHGHSSRDPVEPARALDALLRHVGVVGDRIPESTEERSALWRATVADRRLLLVLDNAASTEQVGPLLPADAGSLVLITSRRRLAGLDGATTLSLDVLSDAEAHGLLRIMVGDRIDSDAGSTAEITALCGNLALALRLAGARLVHRPTWQARDLAALLRQATRQRHLFGAEGHTVASAFALSYEQLSPAAQRLFRLLGVPPGRDIDAATVAALSGLSVPRVGRAAG